MKTSIALFLIATCLLNFTFNNSINRMKTSSTKVEVAAEITPEIVPPKLEVSLKSVSENGGANTITRQKVIVDINSGKVVTPQEEVTTFGAR